MTHRWCTVLIKIRHPYVTSWFKGRKYFECTSPLLSVIYTWILHYSRCFCFVDSPISPGPYGKIRWHRTRLVFLCRKHSLVYLSIGKRIILKGDSHFLTLPLLSLALKVTTRSWYSCHLDPFLLSLVLALLYVDPNRREQVKSSGSFKYWGVSSNPRENLREYHGI